MNATLPPAEHARDLAGDMRSAAAIRYYILRRLTDYYPDLAPETASVEVVSRRHAFAKNNHVICHVRACTRQGVWVRRGIYGKTDQLAEQEYANLRELWHAHFRGDAANRIPRPLDYYPEHRLLLTEFLPAQSGLLPWLLAYTSPLGRYLDRRLATARMQQIADWLVAFQARMRVAGLGPADIDEAIDDLAGISSLPAAARDRIARWLAAARPDIASVAPVASHGDFAARNILLDQHSVTVVDWEKPLVSRHPLYDVQTFVVNLERRLSYPLCSSRRVQEMKQAFLSRYLAQAPFAAGERALAAARVVVLVHQLRAQEQAALGRPAAALLKRRRRFIGYLAAEIERGIGLG